MILNAPGLLLLSAPMAESRLGAILLLFLPSMALWALPAAVLRNGLPGWFAVGEFGVYPAAVGGWCLLFGFWSAVALAIATVVARRRRD